jgi:hypothetical protein
VFLLHGTPKTMSYWRHVVPLLTPHHTVITVDNQLAQVARDVRGAVIPAAGHNIALENATTPAQACLDFFAGGS